MEERGMLKMSWRGNGSRGESKERREWRKFKVKTNGMLCQ